KRLLDVVDAAAPRARRPELDQLARDALLALSSDWAFMVTKDSAAAYARDRARGHLDAFEALARAVDRGGGAGRLAARQRATDGPFGHLDARLIRTAGTH
ncbi:MAG: 1,4-alpha-glucan branching protein domain-containing protein, partial [Kineosporiaceae bacterium]